MEQIKQIELTEEDFKMLYDGLEALPTKDIAGDMIGMMFSGLITDETKRAEHDLRMKREMEAKDKKRQQLIENVRILQGKILTLKRLLVSNRLMKDVDGLINGKDESTT